MSAGVVRAEQPRRLARELGWFTVALGAGPLLDPSGVARLAGVKANRRNLALLRGVGLRELVVAAGLLRGSPAWLWARVGQDAMDVPLALAAAVGRRGRARARARRTAAALLAITAVDVYAAVRTTVAPSPTPAGKDRTVRRIAAITVNHPPAEVRRLWPGTEDLLPPLDEGVRMDPAPGDRGTEVRVPYEEDRGLGQKLKALAGTDVRRRVEDALRRFKQVVETGEVVRSEASPEGTDAARQRHQRPAQPLGVS